LLRERNSSLPLQSKNQNTARRSPYDGKQSSVGGIIKSGELNTLGSNIPGLNAQGGYIHGTRSIPVIEGQGSKKNRVNDYGDSYNQKVNMP